MRKLRWILAAALLATSCTASSAPAGQDALEMHHAGAGALDASGWTDASSTQGAFSVRLPCPYNDFTVHGGADGAVARSFVVGCKLADGSKYTATRLVYRGGAPVAEGFFEQAAKAGLWPESKFTAGAHEGARILDSAVAEGDGCAWSRLVRTGQDNVVLVVEGKGQACLKLEDDARRFVDSVKVRPW